MKKLNIISSDIEIKNKINEIIDILEETGIIDQYNEKIECENIRNEIKNIDNLKKRKDGKCSLCVINERLDGHQLCKKCLNKRNDMEIHRFTSEYF